MNQNTARSRPYLNYPSIAQMKAGLKRWQKRFPKRIKVTRCAKTLNGRDLLLADITDHRLSDEDKQIVLITCTHAGREVNSTTSALHLIKWLIGNSDLASTCRRKQRVLVLPACAPDAYEQDRYPGMKPDDVTRVRGEGNPCMTYWTWTGVMRPDINPEAVAIAKLIERYPPDVHVDLHGFPHRNAYMAESTGISWGSGISRCHKPQIVQLINEAADAAGFSLGNTDGENSAGAVRVTAPIRVPYRPRNLTVQDRASLDRNIPGHHFFLRPPNINATTYSYHRTHALALTMEIGFEQSAVVRLQKLLEIGNQRWPTEYYDGYPTNHMSNGLLVAVAAWGETERQRRRSRVELWSKFDQICFGYPQMPQRGELIGVVSTTTGGARNFFGVKSKRQEESRQAPGGYGDRFEVLLSRLRGHRRFNLKQITEFIGASAVEQYHCFSASAVTRRRCEPLRHGLGFRLFLPDGGAKVRQVHLDGHRLSKSTTDGYLAWAGSGTTVQVNIPPRKVKDFHIVPCRYQQSRIWPDGFCNQDREI